LHTECSLIDFINFQSELTAIKKQCSIIAILHDEGNGIVVDIAPRAKDITLQQSYQSLFEAFYHLDQQMAALAA
jgi:hypothetical protein